MATTGFEAKLRLTSDKRRNHMDPGGYRHAVPGLVLKYIPESFGEHRERLHAGEGNRAGASPGSPEAPDEYRAEDVFRGPVEARREPLPGITGAMDQGERNNPPVRGRLSVPVRPWFLRKNEPGGSVRAVSEQEPALAA